MQPKLAFRKPLMKCKALMANTVRRRTNVVLKHITSLIKKAMPNTVKAKQKVEEAVMFKHITDLIKKARPNIVKAKQQVDKTTAIANRPAIAKRPAAIAKRPAAIVKRPAIKRPAAIANWPAIAKRPAAFKLRHKFQLD